MWVVHFTDKNGKATVSICQSRDAAFKSARGLREHFCAVHYISGPNGARIELKEILDWCSQQARNVGLEASLYSPDCPAEFRRTMRAGAQAYLSPTPRGRLLN